MGTTQTALRGSNPTIAYVLAIEGYPYLLTSGSTADCVTAWAATSWTQALPGLQVSGSFRQELKPWSNEINVPRFSFSVIPDATDQFAIDMFKAKPDIRRELTTGFDTADSGTGSFNIAVQDATPFSGLSYVYIGNETFGVSSAAGKNIAVSANGSGLFSPFSGNVGVANTFPGPHNLPGASNVSNFESESPIWVADSPGTWIGKKVGLYVHKITGGVWDLEAQAELWFAGTITGVSESGIATVVDCDGIQQQLVDASLLQTQWTGSLQEGVYLTASDYFQVRVRLWDIAGANITHHTSAKLTPGAGKYTAEELGVLIGEHCDQDATIGDGSTPDLRWKGGTVSAPEGLRFSLAYQSGSSIFASFKLFSSSRTAMVFCGFENLGSENDDPRAEAVEVQGTDNELLSETAPYRSSPIGVVGPVGVDITIIFDDTEGTYLEHTDLLPPDAQKYVQSGDSWSFFLFGDDALFLGKRDSDTQISGVTIGTGLTQLTVDQVNSATGMRASESRATKVKQVAYLSGSFCDIMTKITASIDGNGHNHATYDVLPFGAGIPWGLLGQNWLDSLGDLEQAGVEDSISMLLTKPTRLWDAVKADFAMRMAGIVWKDGGLQVVSLTVPNATATDATLDETNKSDGLRTVPELTSEFLAHSVKILYNRDPVTDKYRNDIIVRDKTAYESAGGSGVTKTIKARNTYAGSVGSGSSVEAMGDMLAAKFLPILARPLKRWRRSITHRHFHLAPGDTVTFSDNWVRNPSTGVRGVVNRPCTVLAVSGSFGIASGGGQEYFGEIDLLYTEEDRLFPVSPSLEHATATGTETGRNWTNGYDDEVGTGGVFSILVQQYAFGNSGVDSSDATHFTAGDAINITEYSPATPASPDTFTDVVVSVGIAVTTISSVVYDEIVLTTGFGNGGNPAFSGTKTYIINFDSFTSCVAAQQLHAFQADSADGQIQNTQDPNLISDRMRFFSQPADLTLLPAKYSTEQHGDGVPMSANFLREQCRMANNLVNYKTAPHSPMLARSAVICSTAGAGEYVTIWVFPFYLGLGRYVGSRVRKINVSPMFKAGGGTVTVRVTSSSNPPNGDVFVGAVFAGAKQQKSFSTTSATDVIPASAELTVVPAESFPGYTWITVEGNDLVSFRGLPVLWLGPQA